tara:strand:- start:140 stop:487 length:348 start_codon:yes stop_codon:yes gene_type:complete
MDFCKVPTLLAYAACAYIIATFYYIYETRNIGTPFKDSLTKKQKKIKKKSAKKRGGIFYKGLAIGAAIMFFLQPFNKCSNDSDIIEMTNVQNLSDFEGLPRLEGNLPLVSLLKLQ